MKIKNLLVGNKKRKERREKKKEKKKLMAFKNLKYTKIKIQIGTRDKSHQPSSSFPLPLLSLRAG